MTDEEILAVGHAQPQDRPLNLFAYARAIEAVVIKRLAAGVSVEPSAYRFTENRGNGNTEFNYYGLDEVGMAYRDNCLEITPLYTATAIAAARVAAIEECAKVCEDLSPDQVLNPRDSSFFDVTTLACSEAITRLMGKEAT